MAAMVIPDEKVVLAELWADILRLCKALDSLPQLWAKIDIQTRVNHRPHNRTQKSHRSPTNMSFDNWDYPQIYISANKRIAGAAGEIARGEIAHDAPPFVLSARIIRGREDVTLCST